VSDDDLTHYEVLGVEPGATKDEIRAAYRDELATAQSQVTNAETAKKPDQAVIAAAREEEASVRAAWQILSDPVQRARYDSQLGVVGAPAEDDDDDEEDEEQVVPARAVARRQRDQDLTPREQRAKARAEAMANRPPGLFSTEHPKVPDSWPKGFRPPPPRARLLALLVDITVLGIILLVTQLAIAPAVVDAAYPKQSKQLDHVKDQLDTLNSRKDDADGCADESSNAAVAKSKKCQALGVSTKKEAKAKSNALDKQISKKEDKQSSLQSDLAPAALGVSLGMTLVMLLYLVPSSVRTGRTLGKHLFRVRAINIDGSPLTVRSALARYGAPLLVALFLGSLFGPSSPIVYMLVLFGVLTWPRNASYQGLHDRFARTIVVDG
jgi:curved DNA-binding protein CbpA